MQHLRHFRKNRRRAALAELGIATILIAVAAIGSAATLQRQGAHPSVPMSQAMPDS